MTPGAPSQALSRPFQQVDVFTDTPYQGKYQGQSGPTSSRSHRDFAR